MFLSKVGMITFLLGIFRLGFIDVVLSRSLIRGFVSAIAVVILVSVLRVLIGFGLWTLMPRREQLIPMFGLVALEHALHPDTTLSKIDFLFRNAWMHHHRATTIISFSAFAILVALRYSKRMFPRIWWIYRLPEVLLVVIASICALLPLFGTL